MDLFKNAKINSQNLEKDFFNEVAGEEKKPKREFIKFIEDKGVISVNIPLDSFNIFLETGEYLNRYQLAIKESKFWDDLGFHQINPEQIFKTELGIWTQKREKFRTFFPEDSISYYGVLNVGNSGTELYGEICIILNSSFHQNENEVVFIKNDSLSYEPVELILNECVTASGVSYMAYFKHKEIILKNSTPISKFCPDMICKEKTYIETIFTKKITKDNIVEIRFTNNLCEKIKKCHKLHKNQVKLEKDDNQYLDNFILCWNKLKKEQNDKKWIIPKIIEEVVD